MKKNLFLALAALCACMSAAAQEYNDFFTFRPDKKVRKNVINNWGVSLTYVHT